MHILLELDIRFSEVDYRLSREDIGQIEAVIFIGSPLAQGASVTVRVTPLEVTDVLARRDDELMDPRFDDFFDIIPENNPDRPPYANGEDQSGGN